jgi:hypothetical protein
VIFPTPTAHVDPHAVEVVKDEVGPGRYLVVSAVAASQGDEEILDNLHLDLFPLRPGQALSLYSMSNTADWSSLMSSPDRRYTHSSAFISLHATPLHDLLKLWH